MKHLIAILVVALFLGATTADAQPRVFRIWAETTDGQPIAPDCSNLKRTAYDRDSKANDRIPIQNNDPCWLAKRDEVIPPPSDLVQINEKFSELTPFERALFLAIAKKIFPNQAAFRDAVRAEARP